MHITYWHAFPAFRGFDLTLSYILGWHHDAGDLVFSLDAVLTPDHPHYTPPRTDEWACFRKTELRFEDVSELRGLPSMEAAPWSSDATGELDFGSIDELMYDAEKWTLYGDVGDVVIVCRAVSIALTD